MTQAIGAHLRRVALAAASLSLLPSFAAAAEPPSDGAGLYAQNCAACHQPTGKGIPGAFPALAGDPFVQGPTEPLVTTLLNGRGGMPTFKGQLSNAQIATVISYIRSSWGNHAPAVDAETVARIGGSSAPAKRGDSLQSH